MEKAFWGNCIACTTGMFLRRSNHVVAGRPLLQPSLPRSLEFLDLTQELELLERTRLGLELGIPGISLLGGFNGGYYSYGVSVDAGAMKLTGGFYGLETGGGYRRTQSKRFIV
jgi:hypothetical protein